MGIEIEYIINDDSLNIVPIYIIDSRRENSFETNNLVRNKTKKPIII